MTLLVTCTMILGWVISVILEICKAILVARFSLFGEALEADIESIKNVIHVPEMIMSKITGKPMEEKEPPSRRRQHLTHLVEVMKQDNAEKKERKKADRAREKEQRKEKLTLK